MAPPPKPRETMIQFTYKLKLNDRVRAKWQSPLPLKPRKTHYFRIAGDPPGILVFERNVNE